MLLPKRMDAGGNRNFGGGGRRGDYQLQGGRERGNGQILNRGGGRGWYAHRQPPSQGQWINPPHQARVYGRPQMSEPHRIGGRAGAWGPSPNSTPLYRPSLPPQPSPVMGSRRNNWQRGGRRYHHNQPNKGNGRWRDSQQYCCSCRHNLNQSPLVKLEQIISKLGKLDLVPASGTVAGDGPFAPPAQPGDHMNRVFGTWTRTWKPPFLPLEWRADLCVSFGWRLNWR